MKINEVDYYSIYGKSFLHHVSAEKKLAAALIILLAVILFKSIFLLSTIYIAILLISTFLKNQTKNILILSIYPLVFLLFFLISINNLSSQLALLLILKVLTAATTFILLVFTTPYTNIFNCLKRFMPYYLVSVLFMTYRSIFILGDVLDVIKTTLYIRGGISIKRPLYSLGVIGNVIGFLLIKSINNSENMYNTLRIKGYSWRNIQ